MTQLTKALADTLSNVGVNSSYGDPIEVDGTTIVPVAVTTFGFGAGEGDIPSHSDTSEGSGGGGGGFAAPVGAYMTRNGVTRFEPNTVALLALGIPLVFVTGRAMSRIIKALKG